jgi:phage protein D
MPETNLLASQIFLTVDGKEVPKEVMQELVEVVVDQHTHLPNFFTIRLHDPELKLMDSGPFNLTKPVEIKSETGGGAKVTLFKGEITSLEPSFGEGMIAELLVRGYDKSHRLFRETRSKAYVNIKDSDLANQIASRAGLSAKVDDTRIVYEHLYQHNQTDMDFLMQRAWRIGFECFVDEAGSLVFRKPVNASASMALAWGLDLLSFHPRMVLAEQVDEVQVKGWNPAELKPIVGKAANGKLYAKTKETKNGAAWAKAFGTGKVVIVDQPVISQAEATALAEARMDEISGAFVEAEGLAFRRPDIRAGKMVKLEALGKRWSGDYLVTNARHEYSAEGLRTTFTVRGSRTGLLTEQLLHQPPIDRWPGVVPAIVTNAEDPKGWGRVKVKFPWMSEVDESNWARLLGIGAGPDAGLCVVPDVGDEVLVVFEQGSFDHPIVLGGFWNGQHRLPPETKRAAKGEKPLVRTWHSRKGHWIAIYDDAGNDKIEIVTRGGHRLTLDDKNRQITIVSKGGQKITLDDQGRRISVESTGDVEVKAQKNITVQASANLSLQANGNMDLKANGMVTVRGATIQLN